MKGFESAISAMIGSPNMGRGLDDYYELGFSAEQVDEIQKGLIFGVDVSCYARRDYEPEQMSTVRELMIAGIDIAPFTMQYDY